MNMLKLKRENVNEELEKDMTPKLIKEVGLRFPTEKSIQRSSYGLFECQYCGRQWETIIYRVKSEQTKSCGCVQKVKCALLGKSFKTHGLSNHRLYKTWCDMKSRCYNINNKDYAHYGGRGIVVCNEWKTSFQTFYDWALSSGYESHLSIDRIDVDAHYSPNNCRWGTQYSQTQNTRDIKSNNTSGYRGVTFNKENKKWISCIVVSKVRVYLGTFDTALEAAKAYEMYVRLNNLEHNFTPALIIGEIEEINKQKEGKC